MYIVNSELDKLNVWFRVNKLSLNISKTNYILFGKKSISQNFHVLINGVTIERVEKTKFLGVYIDKFFSWCEHINYVHSKVSKSLGIIYKAKSKLNEMSLLLLYNTLILPYLTYCCEIALAQLA